MGFKDIDDEIKEFYTSTEGSLVDNFYNIVLSHAKRYDRLSGYFRSSSLAAAAVGISNFIKNEGHMRLLCGTELTKDDLESIKSADELKNIINRNFLGDYENLENELIKNHVKLLGWMIANNFLEIKIGIHIDGNKYYPKGILHSKRGILYDEYDDCVLFTGSLNETLEGWSLNLEDLDITKSWHKNDKIDYAITNFEKLWNGEEKSLLIYDVPEASKRKLIKEAPKNKREIQKIIDKINKLSKEKEPFPHQLIAIQNWFKNNNHGIFEMATGTGKTFTSLKALEKLYKTKKNILTVIACPYSHIITQWEQEIHELNLGKTYTFYGLGNPKWRQDFDLLKQRINLGVKFEKPNIILTSHQTFCKPDFINRILNCDIETCLIVDEMHHVGAKKYNEGVLPEYNYKLGLSATPSRYMDYEGTENLINQFGEIIFKFSILEALNKTNPKKGESFLTPYYYHPKKVELTSSELIKYNKINKKIGRASHITKNEDNKYLKSLLRERRDLINNAENKWDVFRDILKELDHKDHLIVFCSDKQLNKVRSILYEEGITPRHKFTQKEDANRKKGDKLSQREELLYDFDRGECKALVAIKCLDEGVDVPSADQVIIMSSTTNPAEYIQRRGRVLRRYPGKEKADIYDICVIPEEEFKGYNNSVKSETKRLIEFLKTAKNKKECRDMLNEWGIL